MTTTEMPRTISRAQRDLIENLCKERGLCMRKFIAVKFPGKQVDDLTAGRNGEASKIITALYKINRGTSGTTRKGTTVSPGLYKVDGGKAVVRVSQTRAGTWYAQQVMKNPDGTFRWSYLGHRVDLAGAELVDKDVAVALLEITRLR